MGSISIGAYVPPDVTTGGVLSAVFAISLGQGTETAIALVYLSRRRLLPLP